MSSLVVKHAQYSIEKYPDAPRAKTLTEAYRNAIDYLFKIGPLVTVGKEKNRVRLHASVEAHLAKIQELVDDHRKLMREGGLKDYE